MNTTALREVIADLLPHWKVTINEQTMLNVQADDYEKHDGFAYIEEFVTSRTTFGFGKRRTYTHNLYLCVFTDFDLTAEQREATRMKRLYPVMEEIETALHDRLGVEDFEEDLYPKGFDGNEVLVHLRFRTTENVC